MRVHVPLAALVFVAMTVANAQIHFTARIDGLQEVPPVSTTATGTGSFTLSSDLTMLKWTISYQGLSGTLSAAHFHTGSPGIAGPVVKAIAGAGGSAEATISGTWTSTDASQALTAALLDSLLTGRVYVNFHTSANPSGEVRGQVVLATGIHFTASLSGSQENPPVAGNQGGTGAFTLNPSRTKLQWDVTYRDMTGSITAAHFHTADSGRNGGVVRNISGAGSSAGTLSGVWLSSDATQPLTAALVDSLIAGKLYVNFHTSANPGGEVRGQLRLNGGVGFVARLDGSQENPPVATSASGTGSFFLDDARTDLNYEITFINLSGAITAGHFHIADSGRNGPVVRQIISTGNTSGTISGVWRNTDSSPLTAALVESLLTGRAYVNLHTSANPGGEMRGQVQLSTGVGFTSRLSGSQENPPVATAAAGTGSVVLNARRDTVMYDVTYDDLSGTVSAAHFHVGAVGMNGPVVKNIASSGGAASGTVGGLWTSTDATQALTRTLVDSMIAGRTYINFHTAANPSGEMRGQVKFGSDVVTSVRRESDQTPAKFRLEQNYPNPFNPETVIPFAVSERSMVTLKVYDILGQEIRVLVNEVLSPGLYTVRFSGTGVASGVYFYRLTGASGSIEQRKMILLK